ncbi:MAG: 16S rRNA (cytidine(1402)-2'-O)-methyltransferase [Chloroflexota bacterium]|nr:16S rRNA (cytidine(1402)-2'-O)-methyltransferase [Chloroflexota bacterium]
MLYLVATPIGNLDDITLRALETLKEVDVVASEDTRKTGRLLKHFDIEKRQISFHEHNKERATERIMALLQGGKSVALVTSAGTPGIADPGFTLVRAAIQENVDVTMIPGPTAFVVALVLSNLPLHSFTFRGFTPRKTVARKKFFEADRDSPYTLIYYESPYRLIRSLKDALAVFGDRQAALGHELTKLHETVIRGTLSEILEQMTGKEIRGEYVLLIAGSEAA